MLGCEYCESKFKEIIREREKDERNAAKRQSSSDISLTLEKKARIDFAESNITKISDLPGFMESGMKTQRKALEETKSREAGCESKILHLEQKIEELESKVDESKILIKELESKVNIILGKLISCKQNTNDAKL